MQSVLEQMAVCKERKLSITKQFPPVCLLTLVRLGVRLGMGLGLGLTLGLGLRKKLENIKLALFLYK